jgi:uncharacterized membrane protein YhaH (DUF805 family)
VPLTFAPKIAGCCTFNVNNFELTIHDHSEVGTTMTFPESVSRCLRNYVTFSGRASRPEYWWFVLFLFLGGLVANALDTFVLGHHVFYRATGNYMHIMSGNGPVSALFNLATLLPGLSVFVRRMHDTGRSGWWFWLVLIPLVGWIILLVWLCRPTSTGPNQYGAEPPQQAASTTS